MHHICSVVPAGSLPAAILILICLSSSLAQGQFSDSGAPVPLKDHVSSLAFAADGSLLAGAGLDKIRVWEMKKSQLLRTITTGGPGIADIEFSPQAGLLAAGCADGKVRLWNTETGQLIKTLDAGDDSTYFVLFSPDGKLLASTHRRHPDCGADGKATAQLRLWDVARGAVLRTLVDGEADFIASPAFSSEGRQLAAVMRWGVDAPGCSEIRFWNVDNDSPARRLSLDPTNVQLLRFLPDSQSLVTVGRRTERACTVREMARWDLQSGKAFWWIEELHSGFHDIAVSPDGLAIASIGIGPWKSPRWRDIRPVTSGSEFVLRNAGSGRVLARAEGEGDGRTGVAFSPDGTLLATCDDRQVALRDAKTGSVQQVLWPFPGTP